MKFRMTLVLLLAMLFTMFNGCGGNQKGSTEAEDPWEKAKNLEPVDLVLYLPDNPTYYSHYYGNQLLYKMPKELNKRLKMINAKIKIGNVDFVTMPLRACVYKSYKKAILSGDKMDLFFINFESAESPSLPGLHDLSATIKYLGENNYAADLTELFSNFAPKYYQRFEKKELDMLVYKGKLLAIPSLNYPEVTRTVAVVREDLMKKYNVKPIKSMKDYENYLQTIKMKEKDMVPMLFGNAGGISEYELFDLFGRNYGYTECDGYYNRDIVYRLDDAEIKLIPWEQTGEFFEIAKKIREWRINGYVAEFRQPDMLDVSSGKYASFISKSGAAESYNQMLKKDGGRPWKYVEYELYPDSTVKRKFNPFSIICVNPRSPNKERAVMLVELLMNDQKSYDIFTCGVENEDFTYDGKKIPKPKVPSGYILDYDSYMYNNKQWCLSNIFMQHEDEKVVNEKLKSLKTKTVLDPAAGFIFDQQDSSTLTNLPGDLISTSQKLCRGELSVEEIQEYIKAMKPYTEVKVKELQLQLDEWKLSQKR